MTETKPKWLEESKLIWQEDDTMQIDAETLKHAWNRLVPDSGRVRPVLERWGTTDYIASLFYDGWICVTSCEGAEIRRELKNERN